MISPDELKQALLFSDTPAGELERLAAVAADVHLMAGEALVREDEAPGFYVLLEGYLRGTKIIHGAEQVLVQYRPGEFFGEIPYLMGTLSAISIHAESTCRLARFELQQLQELIDPSSPSSKKILHTMTKRILEIQRYAQTVPKARVVIRSSGSSEGCQKVRAFLAANRIPYEWQVGKSNPQPPTDVLDVVVDGAARLRNPSIRQLAEALRLQTEPKRSSYDVVIIGAGPAGMAAAVYGASEGLHVLMVERGAAGGQAGTSSRIENYLGFPSGISGSDLSDRALRQALRFGAEIALGRSVEALRPQNGGYCLTLDGDVQVRSRCVLIATGVNWRRLEVDRLEDFIGHGVLYGAARTEAAGIAGKKVFIVGGGNSAGQAAMFFSDYAAAIHILIRGESLAAGMSQYLIAQLASKANITVETHTRVIGVGGAGRLETLETLTMEPGRPAQLQVRAADALYVMIGAEAKTDWLPAELQRDEKGFLLTDRSLKPHALGREAFALETSLPGVFCAGDVRHGSVKRVASGVGEGSMAVAFIHQYLGTLADN